MAGSGSRTFADGRKMVGQGERTASGGRDEVAPILHSAKPGGRHHGSVRWEAGSEGPSAAPPPIQGKRVEFSKFWEVPVVLFWPAWWGGAKLCRARTFRSGVSHPHVLPPSQTRSSTARCSTESPCQQQDTSPLRVRRLRQQGHRTAQVDAGSKTGPAIKRASGDRRLALRYVGTKRFPTASSNKGGSGDRVRSRDRFGDRRWSTKDQSHTSCCGGMDQRLLDFLPAADVPSTIGRRSYTRS